jgi:hypothetical protein
VPVESVYGDPFDDEIKQIVKSSPSWGAIRSTADYLALEAIVHGMLRDAYRRADAYIHQIAGEMIRQGAPLEQVARWRIEATNELKMTIRKQGNMLVEVLAKMTRGPEDCPTYEMLIAKGKKNEDIISRVPNKGVDKIAAYLKVAGRTILNIDIGVSGYKIVSAPVSQMPQVAISEGSRFAGALTGAWVGAKAGAKIFGTAASFFSPGLGTAIGAGAGGIIGGIIGGIVGGWATQSVTDWALDKLFPPKDTYFKIIR